ncbi:MAG: nucleotidyltransferase family protein [Candidatus Woesearchaeota archaeon]
MAYVERKTRNQTDYFYRAHSVRFQNSVKKRRIYLGKNLTTFQLARAVRKADQILAKQNELEKIIHTTKHILEKYQVQKASIAGSFARLEQKKTSDIDIVIQPPKNFGFALAKIEQELEKALKRKIDLLTYNSISPILKTQMMQEQVQIL